MFKQLALAAALSLSASATTAATVDLELVLLTDVSGSVDSTDYDLIQKGYAEAFRDATVIDKIMGGAIGKIAVQVIQFSSSAQAALGGGWTIIDSVASSHAFADALEAMARLSASSTGTTRGMIAATAALTADNGIESTRQVIDVATDGSDNVDCNEGSQTCIALQNARDAAIDAGVDGINALLINDRNFFGDDAADTVKATPYAEDNIIAGPNSFAHLIEGFPDFGEAIKDKLVREVTPPPPPSEVPVPAAGLMLLAGLGGLGALVRRRRAAA